MSAVTAETLKNYQNLDIEELCYAMATVEQGGLYGLLPSIHLVAIHFMGLYRRQICKQSPMKLTCTASKKAYNSFAGAQKMIDIYYALIDGKVCFEDADKVYMTHEKLIQDLFHGVIQEHPFDEKELDGLFDKAKEKASMNLCAATVEALDKGMAEEEILKIVQDVLDHHEKDKI